MLNHMYILFTLFFVSLLGIIFMIGRKLLLIQNGYVFKEETFALDGKYLEELKTKTVRSIQKLGFVTLVITIRIYVKVSNFFQSEFKEALEKIRNMRAKKSDGITIKIKRENKFLKMVSQYKRRIKKIKEKVKQEESL